MGATYSDLLFTKILWLMRGEWIAGEQSRRLKIMGPGISIGLVAMDKTK